MSKPDNQIDATATSTGEARGGEFAQDLEAEPSARRRLDTTPAPDAVVKSGADDLPIDSILDVLSNERRRYVITHLSREGPVVGVSELTDSLARFEATDPDGDVTANERKRVYVALYQCHLPLLDKHDVVEFDKEESEVVVGRNFPMMSRYLTALRGVTEGGTATTSSAGYFSLVIWTALTAGGISIFTSSLVVNGLPISGVGVAVLSALITWAGVSLYVRGRWDNE